MVFNEASVSLTQHDSQQKHKMESIQRESSTYLRRRRGSLICFTRDYMTILTPCNAPNLSAQHQHVHRVCLSLHLINRRLQNRKEHSTRFLFSKRWKKKIERNLSSRNSLQQTAGVSEANCSIWITWNRDPPKKMSETIPCAYAVTKTVIKQMKCGVMRWQKLQVSSEFELWVK